MRHTIKELLPFISLVILFCVLSLLSPDRFLTKGNLLNVLRRSSIVVIMATGMTFVIISGGIDLSVGSLLALTGVCGAMAISKAGVPVWAGVLVGMLVGAICGLVNGLLTTGLRIHPFIPTLGMMMAFRGTVLTITKEVPVTQNLPSGFGWVGEGAALGLLPVPVVLMLIVTLSAAWILRYTRLGRYTYAIGSNREAAYHSGINVSGYLIVIYSLCGLLTGLSGMITAARLNGGYPTEGEAMELTVIAAVVIGGGSFNGGEGNILGTVVGALLMAVLRNGCILQGVDLNMQKIVIGALIVIAVAVDQYVRRRGAE